MQPPSPTASLAHPIHTSSLQAECAVSSSHTIAGCSFLVVGLWKEVGGKHGNIQGTSSFIGISFLHQPCLITLWLLNIHVSVFCSL